MDNIQSPLDYTNEYTKPIYKKRSKFGEVKPNEKVTRELTWVDFGKITHDDLSIFSFAPLEEIKKNLLESGHSADEVDNIIEGLSQLPEYDSSK